MKQFILFAGDNYYPRGGWYDFVDSFDKFEDAQLMGRRYYYEWYHIIDTADMAKIWSHHDDEKD